MHRVARLICHLPLVAGASPGMEERGHPVGTVELGAGEGALEVPQIINGCWQFAGGHGQLSPDSLVEAMHSLAAGGLNAFDTADIYGPSEKIVGQMVKSCDQATPPLVLTKLVPRSNSVGAEAVAATVDRSLAALNVASLDLVQYHTWDYGISGEVRSSYHYALVSFCEPLIYPIITGRL
jgi:aryl-alcohol dehydrogenase-like predicted oxidoreductase